MNTEKTKTGIDAEVMRKITESVQKIHFGAVEIIIHDSKVVQIESREKVRFDKN